MIFIKMKTNTNKPIRQQFISIVLLSTLPSFANARYGYHGGGWQGSGSGGNGGGQGMGMGMGHTSSSAVMDGDSGSEIQSRREMMQLIHQLIDSHDDVTRYYNETDGGIESYTFSDDPKVSQWIQDHVNQMTKLMSSYPEHGGIRMRDPLFKAAFDFSSFHEMHVSNTEKGVRVVQNVVEDVDDASTKACTISIIQDHAAVVSEFVARGRSEMRKNHDAPFICKSAPGEVYVDARTSDPFLATRSQETEEEVVSALAATAANAAAISKNIGPGYTAAILASVLFVAKVMF